MKAWLIPKAKALVVFSLFVSASIFLFAFLAYGQTSNSFERFPIEGGQSRGVSLDVPAEILAVDEKWQSTSTNNAPAGRYGHTMIWNGSEMIVWGGYYHLNHFLNDGGRYDPGSDTWTSTSTNNAPIGRSRHTAVWTGKEMIVWGGESGGGGVTTNTGGRYNPATDTWSPTSLYNVPSPRQMHSAIWTGDEMIVWGGCSTVFCTQVFNDGGIYDPATDTWVSIPGVVGLTPRNFHQAVWTGEKMIVWGGSSDPQGVSYDPETGTWADISTVDAPVPTWKGSGVWTGEEMMVWGGCTSFSTAGCPEYVDSGGRYNPDTDTWTPITKAGAPAARWYHTAVWTGVEMLAWGGCGDACYNSGGVYDPETDAWSAMDTTNAPVPRSNHKAVWSGDNMIVWGGCDVGICGYTIYYNTGGRYTPARKPPRELTYLPVVVSNRSLIAYTGEILIKDIFYDGVKGSAEPDEYVEIRNDDSRPIQMAGWTLQDEANQVFTFPGYVMQPGQTCRVFTNEYHPDWCGFSFANEVGIWNNSGDCAFLSDSTGAIIDTYCY